MWDELSPKEQLDFLCNMIGSLVHQSINYSLIENCEQALSVPERLVYVDHVSGHVADHIYRKYDPEHENTAQQYYYAMMRVPLELKAKMIWCARTGNQP